MRPWLSVGGHALHPVDAGFVFQPGEDVAAGDLGHGFLDAAELIVGVFEGFELPALRDGIFLVHLEEFGGE